MPWRSRWSSARLSSTAASGANASRVLELERRRLADDDRRRRRAVAGERASAPCRRCRRPSTGSPASRWMCPISSTVVVLPLEPVTATNSLRQQPPAELELAEHAHPALARGRDDRRLLRHAGALDERARRRRAASTPVVAARARPRPAASSRARAPPARPPASHARPPPRRARAARAPRPRPSGRGRRRGTGRAAAAGARSTRSFKRARRPFTAGGRPTPAGATAADRGAADAGRSAAGRPGRRLRLPRRRSAGAQAPRRRVGAAALELEPLGLEAAADLGRVAERGAADRAVATSGRGGRPATRRG